MRTVPHPSRTPSASWARRSGLGLALAAALVMPAAASADVLVVDDDGTYDAGTDGCDGADAAFTTINDANTAAVDGDTVLVCPGTYVEIQVHITKAITLQGSGAATTIIDGGGGNALVSAGTVVVSTNTGDVTVDGFTIQNPSSTAGGLSFGIQAESSQPITITITNNVIKGTNDPAASQDYGFYSDGPGAVESLVFQNNTITQTGSNPILLENHTGPTDVSFNTFDRGVSQNGVSAYFNFAYGGLAITSLQRASNNVIDLGNDPGPYTSGNASGAITFFAAFTGSTVGSYSNVEISGNTITGVQEFRRGISVFNNSNAPGTNGEISNAVISCNDISGPGAPSTQGIRLFGLVSNPTVTGNAISGVATGFLAREWNGHVATGITLNENSFTNIGSLAIDWWSNVSFDAERNWFGDASGPADPIGNPSGTGAAIGATGGPGGSPALDYVPWLGHGEDADAGACFVPGDSADDCAVGPTECDGVTCTGTPEVAGTECRAAGDACEEPATCDGVSAICPANPEKPDNDSDGLCDEIDACTTLEAGQIFATKPKSRVVLSKINTETIPGNDTMVISGFFTLPAGSTYADIDPLNEGVRVVLVADDGFTRLDVDVPSGAYDKLTKTGWKVSPNGKNWTFVDRNPTPATGINQVVINDKNSTKTPNRVKVTVKAKKTTIPVVGSDTPIKATVTLGDAAAAAQGLCGESAYTAPDCAFNPKGNRLTCRR